MSESIKKKTVKGVVWSAADAFLGYGVTFLVGIILARLLSPSEYGLIGICTIFITILTSVENSGFSTALIRKKEVTDDDYNTMFITNLGMSVFLYLLLYLCSPWISSFFNQIELLTLIRVMGLILIIQALSFTQVTILNKNIDFKTKTKASFISALISGGLGIGMAVCGYGVWSLVGQQMSNRLLYTFCLWIFVRWCPHFRFNIQSFRYMWGFGWKIMISGLINNIWNQLYQVVVGKYYSAATLGQYTRSKEYASLFSQNFTAIIQRVTYPALSELQDDRLRLVMAYRKTIKITMFVSVVCMFFLGAVAEPLLFCLIGPKWNEAASYLPLICVSMSLYPLHSINLNMLQVLGRSDIFLELEIIKKIIAVGPLLLGVFVDIYWMLLGSIVIGIVSFFLNTYYTGKKLDYSSWMQIKDIAPSYFVATIVSITVYFMKYLSLSYFTILSLQFFCGICIFFTICELMKVEEYRELKNIIYKILSKYRLLSCHF